LAWAGIGDCSVHGNSSAGRRIGPRSRGRDRTSPGSTHPPTCRWMNVRPAKRSKAVAPARVPRNERAARLAISTNLYAQLILSDKYPATDPTTLPPGPQNGHTKRRNRRSGDLRRRLVTRIRKPLLYPLSYEGAVAQPTCQRIPPSAQECPAVPTGVGRPSSDRRSTHGASGPRPAGSAAHRRPAVTTAAQNCPRLTEQFPSTRQDRGRPSDLSSGLPTSDHGSVPARGRRQRRPPAGLRRRGLEPYAHGPAWATWKERATSS
jgi:hypothetical protein